MLCCSFACLDQNAFAKPSGSSKMAPKAKYTCERIANIAARSASAARANFGTHAVIEQLLCEYLQQSDETDARNKDGSLKRGAMLTFRWHFKGAGYEETCDITARCNSVAEREVPFPDTWQTAVQCLSLDQIAEKSARNVREQEPSLTEVQCQVLGQVKPIPSVVDAASPSPGKSVALSVNGSRVVYLLCAHVEGESWLCHRGTFADGELDKDSPLAEKDLVAKDIVAEEWDKCPKSSTLLL